MRPFDRMRPRLALLFALSLALSGCNREARNEYAPTYSAQGLGDATTPAYSFGIYPIHSAVELSRAYQPLMDAINRRVTGFTVHMEAARDHPTFEAKLRERQFDLALTTPYQTASAGKLGYRVFGKPGGDETVRGLVVARKDSGIRTVNDLRGKTLVFTSPTAVLTMMCKVALKKGGLDVEKDAKPVYVGQLDSVVMNTYSGMAAAGCVWPPTLEGVKKMRPEVVDALEVEWSSRPLINGGLLARAGVPEAHVNAVARAMFDLDKTEEGRVVLSRINVPRFEPANSKTYDPMHRFLEEYKRLFGKLPELEGPKR
jgi:phosphonate transport system substrate-binding protein